MLVLLFIGLFSSAAARDRYPINDRWEFFFGYRISSDLANYVSLPHTWNADAGAASPDYLRGTGNYLKNINIPSEWNGRRVPEILLSGHHANIAKWRHEQALERTRTRRPDLYEKYEEKSMAKIDK